jgi:hypothetical protein
MNNGEVKPSFNPAMKRNFDEAQTKLQTFVDEFGVYDTLEMLANICENERAKYPASDPNLQSMRVFWRKIQNIIREATSRIQKARV